MAIVRTILGLIILLIVLRDTFESIVLPRTVTRKFRFTSIFYRSLWGACVFLIQRSRRIIRSDSLLNAFGPLSLILLLMLWGSWLIVGFALIHWGLSDFASVADERPGFLTELFRSGSTFVTLGFGVTPTTTLARFTVITEAGTGLGFLAIVIGYLPVIYQSFSRREVGISLLDARAGSPPTGAELLRRHGEAGRMEDLVKLLKEWEHWCSDLLESHLSYPMLVFYRSQHDRESWLSALTAILDSCALIRVGLEGDEPWQGPLAWQARLTFAMARHAVIDLALVLKTPPVPPAQDRLPLATLRAICSELQQVGVMLTEDRAARGQLDALRGEYEPFVNSLACRLLLELPPWRSQEVEPDNWQTSAWGSAQHFHAPPVRRKHTTKE